MRINQYNRGSFVNKSRKKYNSDKDFIDNYLECPELWKYYPRSRELRKIQQYSPKLTGHLQDVWETIKIYFVTKREKVLIESEFELEYLLHISKNFFLTRNLVKAWYVENGYQDELGLEYAKSQMLHFHQVNSKYPRSTDFGGINSAVSNNYWEHLGITNWIELSVHIFGEYDRYPSNHWEGEEGLERAVSRARKFFELNNRIPLANEMLSIVNAISRDVWKLFDIESWNNFLDYVFNKTNRRTQGEYDGVEGLEKAKLEAIQFFDVNNRKPYYSELRHIADFIYAGNWIEFGINRWNDFLLYVFGELNKHPSGYYQGKIGLERAKQEAIAFEKEFGRKPYSLDNYSIHTAIRRGYYTEFGISTFHEFLLYVFNEINVKPSGYYEGKSGLRRAKNEALDYFKENNRQPTSNDLTSIMNSIYRKNWKDYGINTWYDFLVYTFGEANFLPPGYYRGKQGLVNASNKVKKFKMEKGKIPITSDFPSINNVITQKEWVRFGIKCWIDFINYIFDENFRPKGDYDGKPGLRKAVEEAKEFERKNGTKPGCRDLPWIFSAISEMKKWIDLEISSWNEFLRYVFGSVKKKKSGYYNGRKGLDRAMKEVIEFIEINRRMPKINDLPSIANGVYRKYWISFDIKNWKGFLLKCKQLK